MGQNGPLLEIQLCFCLAKKFLKVVHVALDFHFARRSRL